MMDDNFKQDARDLLALMLKTVNPSIPSRAICLQVWDAQKYLPHAVLDKYGYEMENQLGRMFESWSHFSGNLAFPVPCPNGGSPVACYLTTKDVWSGAYGHSRRQLLEHCILEAGKRV